MELSGNTGQSVETNRSEWEGNGGGPARLGRIVIPDCQSAQFQGLDPQPPPPPNSNSTSNSISNSISVYPSPYTVPPAAVAAARSAASSVASAAPVRMANSR